MGKKLINPLLEVVNKKSMLINPYMINTGYGNDFVITITVAAGGTFTLPLRSGYTYNFTCNWGDNTSSVITAYNDADITHTYINAGDYQLKMSGTIQSWYFNNAGDKLKLKSIDNWGNVGLTSLEGAFYGCTNLNLISKAISGGGDILNIRDIFHNCVSITSFPNDLLKELVKCTNCYGAFYFCNSLRSLPNNLFYYMPLVTNYNYTLGANTNIVLPSVLFNLANISIVTTFSEFMSCSSAGNSSLGSIQDIWNYNSNAHVNSFKNQTALANYASIPNNWKGL